MIEFFSNIDQFAAKTANILGLTSVLISTLTWFFLRKQIKQQTTVDNQLINIYLKTTGTTYHLPFRIRRKILTRAEVQGVLRTLPKLQAQYNIAYLATKKYANALEEAQIFPETKLNIEITQQELATYFDESKLKILCKRNDD